MQTDWVDCPVCGEPDMRQETSEDGACLIFCTNLACSSNGGMNCVALVGPLPIAGSWRPIEELDDPEREVLLFFPAIPAFSRAPGTPAVRKFGPLSKFARKPTHFLDPGEPS